MKATYTPAGDDYFLTNYTQLLEYWNKVAKETDRMTLVDIGKTAEGRPIRRISWRRKSGSMAVSTPMSPSTRRPFSPRRTSF